MKSRIFGIYMALNLNRTLNFKFARQPTNAKRVSGAALLSAYLFTFFNASKYFFFTPLSSSFSQSASIFGNNFVLLSVFNLSISASAYAVAQRTTVPAFTAFGSKLSIALSSCIGKSLATFPITFALSHFTLDSSSFNAFITYVNRFSSAIVGIFFVANSTASIQVALSTEFCLSAKAINSSIGKSPLISHSPIVETLLFDFIVLSLNTFSIVIAVNFLSSV